MSGCGNCGVKKRPRLAKKRPRLGRRQLPKRAPTVHAKTRQKKPAKRLRDLQQLSSPRLRQTRWSRC
eukprot:8465211-Prorocentrum_lima.AAC.1